MKALKEKLTNNILDRKISTLIDGYLQTDFEGDFFYYVISSSSYVDNNYNVVRDYELLERVCNLLK